MKVFEANEHECIDVPVESLIKDGEFVIDERIESKGYLNVSLSQGKLTLRSTRFIGLIPLNKDAAVKIKPKVEIKNLNRMIVLSGNIPSVINQFARGYKPVFTNNENSIPIYYSSLMHSVDEMCRRGVLKRYKQVIPPPKWRGRPILSRTVNAYAARGIRYDAEFEYKTLTHDVTENKIIKTALISVQQWMRSSKDKRIKKDLNSVERLLSLMGDISPVSSPTSTDILTIPRLIKNLPVHARHYIEPLWTSYAILQDAIPDVVKTGVVSLDSMMIDVSEVFESYLRRVLEIRLSSSGIKVLDGNDNKNRFSFFVDNSDNKVKPDIIITRRGEVLGILDAKYKPNVKEQDRYEMLAFMEASGVKKSAFICPKVIPDQKSHLLGTTLNGKEMSVIRFDLSSSSMQKEEDKLISEVIKTLSL